MKTEIKLSAASNKEIKKIMDNVRVENSPFIMEIYKLLRKLKEDKLKNNIVIYPQEEFKNFGLKDRAIDRLVARYKDIMLCVDIYNKYDSKMIVKNMMIFAKVIRKVAANIDLDRVIYVRIFKKGNVDSNKGYKIERGYCDKYREFNVDILDLLTISLEEITLNGYGEIAGIMKNWH